MFPLANLLIWLLYHFSVTSLQIDDIISTALFDNLAWLPVKRTSVPQLYPFLLHLVKLLLVIAVDPVNFS